MEQETECGREKERRESNAMEQGSKDIATGEKSDETARSRDVTTKYRVRDGPEPEGIVGNRCSRRVADVAVHMPGKLLELLRHCNE